MRLSKVQPEFKTPIWDYLGFLVDEQRVADGQAMMRKYDRVLRAAEQKFGVNRYVIAAVWGVETDYGREAGDSFLPHALATLACNGGRRKDFWRGELNAALKLVDRGDLALNELYGSWAGAFGQTQFIPSTYQRLAVDFDGDGRRDLVNSVADALGSTANYLNRAGWREGGSWMIEVSAARRLFRPEGQGQESEPLDMGQSRLRACRRKAALRRREGWTAYSGRAAADRASSSSAISMRSTPTIRRSPTRSPSRIWPIGSPAIRRFAPHGRPSDPGLSRAERLRLQELLLANGYDIGTADGKIGPATRAAIAQAETRFGMEPTGRAGKKIYQALGGG